MSLDRLGFNVADFAASRAFFVAALAPLNIVVVSEGQGWAMLGADGHGDLWFGAFGSGGTEPRGVHLAFRAATRDQVRAFHTAALAAGGRDNGGPGLRPQYAPDYYAAFVIGPDGHNLEAVCRSAGE